MNYFYNKNFKSKAPLRLGLAGGGTDVSPYSDTYGGFILNTTINKFAYATIRPRNDGKIMFHAYDQNETVFLESEQNLKFDGKLNILKGVYNKIVDKFIQEPLSFDLFTFVEAPAGSGLGSSSTLVVSVLGAFCEWLKLPLGEYDIAHLAYEIERIDLNMSGGKQDQYAATFGGFNFMEFYNDDKVIVNPLRIKDYIVNELESSLLLYYLGNNRKSASIIDSQVKNVTENKMSSIEAMHLLKDQANMMKNALLRGEVNQIGEILHFGWTQKKKMANEISNHYIDEIYNAALSSGSTGGKISGAGGGGFFLFFCPNNSRYNVINTLYEMGGYIENFQFVTNGLTTWSL